MKFPFQWRPLCSLALLLSLAGSVYAGDKPYYRDLYPDTWVGPDALGRLMPTTADVGPVKTGKRRVVGIFYITWHSDGLHGLKSPYKADVSRILAADPKARMDAKNPLWTEGSYHWGEPECGYFLSRDPFVIRRDMSMLSDAGVDVLIMDVTNAVLYWDEWESVFSVMEQMKAEGNKVPQMCFWAYNGPVINVVQQLYDRIYKEGRYKDLWFYWDDKPLLLYNDTPFIDANGGVAEHPNPHYDANAKTDPKNPHYGDPDYTEKNYKGYTKEVKQFFTLRGMWWGYYEWANQRFVGSEDHWSFGLDLGDEHVKAMKPDELVSRHNGKKEEAAVTPGQHPSSLIGKSWTKEHGEPALNEFDLPNPTYVPWLGKTVEHPEGYGIYFQDRWNDALSSDPDFLYINDWNEWTAGMAVHVEKPEPFMRRNNSYHFVDQYNAEFNRSVSPMKGGYTDNYYMQMAQNIRRYKGARPIPENYGKHTIRMDGKFADWSDIAVEYRDTVGDTAHRDFNGYGGLRYKDESGRNDIVMSKVAVDSKKVYFYVETRENLTPSTGTNWMLLFIDADGNPNTGWQGYDFAINKRVIDNKKTTLQRYDAVSGTWKEVAKLDYRYEGKAMEVAVPRRLLNLKGNAISFDFHWSDNATNPNDIISICSTGDSAPNRRFNYRCIWKQEASEASHKP